MQSKRSRGSMTLDFLPPIMALPTNFVLWRVELSAGERYQWHTPVSREKTINQDTTTQTQGSPSLWRSRSAVQEAPAAMNLKGNLGSLQNPVERGPQIRQPREKVTHPASVQSCQGHGITWYNAQAQWLHARAARQNSQQGYYHANTRNSIPVV
jgi:hypothetical protein